MASNLVSSQAALLDIASMEQEYERLLNWQDLVIRALRNPKMSPVYRELYIALFDTYPDILAGQAVSIEPWRLRENAGWASEASATKFFQDFQSIGAFTYQAGKYDGKLGKRPGQLTPNPDIFPYPESFDTKRAEGRRKAREAEEKRRKQFKDPRKLHSCPVCGSEDLLFDIVAHCKCGYVAEPVVDIPASDLTLEAEIIELADDAFLDEPTQKIPAIRPAVAIQAELPPLPEYPKDVEGLARPDEACLKCGRPRRVCWENSAGTWWYSCNDEMQRAYARAKAK